MLTSIPGRPHLRGTDPIPDDRTGLAKAASGLGLVAGALSSFFDFRGGYKDEKEEGGSTSDAVFAGTAAVLKTVDDMGAAFAGSWEGAKRGAKWGAKVGTATRTLHGTAIGTAVGTVGGTVVGGTLAGAAYDDILPDRVWDAQTDAIFDSISENFTSGYSDGRRKQ